MDILKIISIGIIGTFLSMTVRAYKPELGVLTALSTAFLILLFTVPYLEGIINGIKSLSENTRADGIYIKSIVKIIGIAYVTQFAAELAKDANESLLSKKLELVGKISIIAIMLPVINSLISAVLDTLANI
ncbi:MAG: stage III sporulation protein AD [Clostridia bacterium]|nr:stage III sporulation protein AD [Clostridia bacterium]